MGEQRGQLGDARVDLRGGPTADAQAERKMFADRQCREQRRILRYIAHAALGRFQSRHIDPVQIDPRRERVALTLGCSRAQAFFRVVLPEAWRGVLTAGTLAWARALGEFGPILVFSGATRMRTEVLSTTVFLELSLGDLEAALAVSILMVIAAIVVLGVTRMFGMRGAIH